MKLFDAHLHIIDPRYPLLVNDGYLPASFTCADYLHRMKAYELCGGAVVSASFQGFDQHYLVNALQTLGPAFVGVTQLPSTASDQEILYLNGVGVRAVRFNFRRGGPQDIANIEKMALRIHELCGWHAEFYIDAVELGDVYNLLDKLPAICIDHLGLTKTGFKTLLKLVEKGARVKASGFGRADFDVGNALQQIYSVNLSALMFGTDLPSTRAPRAYHDDDVNLVINALGENCLENIFYNNAIVFYKPISLQKT